MEIANLISGIVQTVISVGAAIVEAAPTHRQCDIEIVNECSEHTLCNPRMYTSSGRCASPLPPKILPSSSGVALFAKTPCAARGSVGIFTYDLMIKNSEEAATEQIAVLFKVPFDLNRKSNVYGVGVFDASKECNRDLFREMSKKVDSTFVRGKAKGPSLIHKSRDFTIMATMSDCYQPIMKVQVSNNQEKTVSNMSS